MLFHLPLTRLGCATITKIMNNLGKNQHVEENSEINQNMSIFWILETQILNNAFHIIKFKINQYPKEKNELKNIQ